MAAPAAPPRAARGAPDARAGGAGQRHLHRAARQCERAGRGARVQGLVPLQQARDRAGARIGRAAAVA
eukprot:scaffold108605_cov66-Phaeocystis_antarctica.AAC.1